MLDNSYRQHKNNYISIAFWFCQAFCTFNWINFEVGLKAYVCVHLLHQGRGYSKKGQQNFHFFNFDGTPNLHHFECSAKIVQIRHFKISTILIVFIKNFFEAGVVTPHLFIISQTFISKYFQWKLEKIVVSLPHKIKQ